MRDRRRIGFQKQNSDLTFGDAVAAVSAVTSDEREVVAVVLHMLRSQAIRLGCERPVLHRPAPPSRAHRHFALRNARGAASG